MTAPARAWRPVDAADLADLVAGSLSGRDRLRVAIDGPPCADPGAFADGLVGPLRALGHPTSHVHAESFWRAASLRLEHGHEDVESYLSWLDADALDREVLAPFGRGEPFLTSLRDPVTDRSIRSAPVPVETGHVLLVSGTFLLGRGLAFDRTMHLYLPRDARARRTRPEQAWTLAAFDEDEATVRPARVADVAVRLDRRTPAVRGL